MGLFSNPKCPIHGIDYRIGKNYMCQEYYFCPKCRQKARNDKEKEDLINDLKQRILKLEKMIC